MIHIGDYWGRKYEYFRYYLPFRIRYGIRFVNPHHCMEAIRNPEMYTQPGFLPTIGNEVIWDIGSQYGDYALIWSRCIRSVVIAFELNENNYIELQRNLMLNDAWNVFACHSAIGNGEIIEYKMEGNMACPSANGIKVQSVKLDDLIKSDDDDVIVLDGLTLIEPNIIKIDIEGFELEVLKGAKRVLSEKSIRLIIETHSSALRKQVDEFLSELNYYPKFVGRTVKGEGWKDEITNVFYLKKVD